MANAQDDNPILAQAEDVNQALRICQASPAERLTLIHRERLDTLADYADAHPAMYLNYLLDWSDDGQWQMGESAYQPRC